MYYNILVIVIVVIIIVIIIRIIKVIVIVIAAVILVSIFIFHPLLPRNLLTKLGGDNPGGWRHGFPGLLLGFRV